VRSTVEPVEPTKVKINVVVEPDELGPAIERTARRLGREVRVPGFRKGKVPRRVLEARIGRDTLLAEAIEHEAVPEFYARAVEEHGVEPLSRAKVDPPDYHDGQPLEFSATVEVKPEIDLPDYHGVQVERPKLEVTDEHVDAQVEQLRERFAQLEVIGRPLAKGDYAQIDLRASRHSEEIPELTRSDLLYEVGSGTVVPQLDEQLEGARKGDILKFNATLPESAGEQLAGQEVTFTVLVKEAKAKILPKLDDDFAQEASEFDTLDELRAHLRERLQEGAEAQNRSETETLVLGKYLDEVDVPLPESLVNDELQFRASRFVQQLNMMGIPLDQYLQSTETTQEQLEADLRAQAERAVKAQLVLEALAEAEGMDASEEEIEAEIQRQAERVGRSPEDVRRALGSRGSGPIRGDILRSKALAYLVEHADVRDAEREGGEAASETADGDQNANAAKE
jgi:trigger factor